mmetsp:Transcript_82606/g.256396  ORF Transcript_82606/g.256396 Transcript_82606/m.256396 type:complete len:385 (+) Transcript_82606:82-1236(+)
MRAGYEPVALKRKILRALNAQRHLLCRCPSVGSPAQPRGLAGEELGGREARPREAPLQPGPACRGGRWLVLRPLEHLHLRDVEPWGLLLCSLGRGLLRHRALAPCAHTAALLSLGSLHLLLLHLLLLLDLLRGQPFAVAGGVAPVDGCGVEVLVAQHVTPLARPLAVEAADEHLAIVPGEGPGLGVDGHGLREAAPVEGQELAGRHGAAPAAVPPRCPEHRLREPLLQDKRWVQGLAIAERVLEVPGLDDKGPARLLAQGEDCVARCQLLRLERKVADARGHALHFPAKTFEEGVAFEAGCVHLVMQLAGELVRDVLEDEDLAHLDGLLLLLDLVFQEPGHAQGEVRRDTLLLEVASEHPELLLLVILHLPDDSHGARDSADDG